jgi:Uncharacterised protein family UPF0547
MLCRWRWATWALVAYNALMPGAVLAGAPFAAQAWILGTMVMAVLWLASHPRRRICPRCRSQLARAYVACPICGHEFYTPVPSRRTWREGLS